MSVERITDVMVALEKAIVEQTEATARGSYDDLAGFAQQQGRLWGLEMARDIAYRILSDLNGEDND